MERIGKIRTKLSEMLSEKFNRSIMPEDIWKQYPLDVQGGAALWGVRLDKGDHVLEISSWSTMKDCVKSGIDLIELKDSNERHRKYDVCARN
jgi:hypothetical protein